MGPGHQVKRSGNLLDNIPDPRIGVGIFILDPHVEDTDFCIHWRHVGKDSFQGLDWVLNGKFFQDG